MKKRVLKKEIRNEIGVNLLKAAQMTDAEIENIVNRPQLFDSIKAKIKAEELNQRKTAIQGRRLSLNFNFRVFGAMATAMILIIAAIVFYDRPNNSGERQLAQNALFTKPQASESSGEKFFTPSEKPKQIVKASARTTTKSVQKNPDSSLQSRSSKTPKVRKSPPVSEPLPVKEIYADEGIFYALPFADDSTGNEFTQIVRAGLSRAELSALGIELPLAGDEDEDEKTVLTDLIYDRRGKPKAFRLINNF